MRYLFLILIIVSVLTTGCYSHLTNTAKSFTHCYQEKDTGIDSLLDNYGFFRSMFIFKSYKGYQAIEYQDTGYINIVFFNDGFFLYNFDIRYFNETKNKRNGFYNKGGAEWGLYIIDNDTIKAQTIETPGMSWLKTEWWFKIIDKNTIEYLYSKTNAPITIEDIFNKQKKEDLTQIVFPYQFVSNRDLPDSDKSWIKKKKWFWCNKERYRDWKKKTSMSH